MTPQSTPNRIARLIRSAAVIGRRDYVATVWSRSFLMFLLGPMVAMVFAGVLGQVGGRSDGVALRPMVVAVVDARDASRLEGAYARLDKRVSGLPELRIVRPDRSTVNQVARLLSAYDRSAAVVLTGWPAAPRITGPRRQIESLRPDVQLLLDEAALGETLAAARIDRPQVKIATTVLDAAGGSTSGSRRIVARVAQTALFMLTILLAGMLLSNLVEEKSNKVIEVLAAAVPVDAIFLGKVVAMLSVSLTGIAIWGGVIGTALVFMLPPDLPLAVPGVGWPIFIVLSVLYFVTNYMILGGLFLGIGAQASTVREVQTLSMPVTMAQLAIFALGSAVLDQPDGSLGTFAALFPLSSPLTMLARAAQDTAIWPHLAALAWQALWVVLIIRFAARRFRVGVLKSGAPPRSGWFAKKREQAES